MSVELSFNERAYGFSVSDINLINGFITNYEELTPGFEYRIEVTAQNPGEVIVSLPESSVYDVLGNPNVQASTSWIYSHIDAVTDIENNGIRIYPNPVNTGLHIELSEKAEIRISLLNGSIVFMKKDVLNEVIDVSGYNPGVYIIQVIGSGRITQHKLVIN